MNLGDRVRVTAAGADQDRTGVVRAIWTENPGTAAARLMATVELEAAGELRAETCNFVVGDHLEVI